MHQPLDFSWNLANNSEQVQKTGVIWGRLSSSIKQTRNAAKPAIVPEPRSSCRGNQESPDCRVNEGHNEALTAGQIAFSMWCVDMFPPQ